MLSFFGVKSNTDATVGDLNVVGNNGRLHTFRVLVNQHLQPNECVAVTGECSSLGRWLPAHCVQLNQENGKFIADIHTNETLKMQLDRLFP